MVCLCLFNLADNKNDFHRWEPNDAFFPFHFIKVEVKKVILVQLKVYKNLNLIL